MPESGLEVTFSAKTTKLESQTAVAKAQMNAFAATVRATSKAVTTASEEMKEALEASLLQQVEQLEAARAHWKALEEQTKKSAEAAQESVGFFGKISESAEKATKSIEATTEKLKVFTALASEVGEFVIVGLGLEQVGEAINHVAETGEQLGKLSEETGLSTEALSALRVVAMQTGTDFGEVQTMLQRLPNTLQEAVNNPTSKAADAFRTMGVQITDSSGRIRPMGDILDEVSAKLNSYADGANKTALETDIFGSKIGANLLPFLEKLAEEGIPGAIVESTRLGETWTGVDSDAATKFEEDLNTVKMGVEGIADSIIRKLLPALDDMAQGFALATGTASIDDQIANTQERINQLGVRAGVGLRDQLTKLEAEKAQLSASAAQQGAYTGGAAPGSVQAPNLKGGGSLGDHQGVSGQDNSDQGDDTDSSGVSSGAGDDGVSKARSAQDQITQIAQDGASARKAIATDEYDAQVSNWDAEVAEGKITKSQEVQDEIDAKNKMYAADLAELQQEAAADQAGTAAKAKALDDILVLQADHNAEMAKLNEDLVTAQAEQAKQIQDAQTQAANATAQAWQRALQPTNQAFDSSINGVIQGTQTLQNAELKAAQSIALAFIDAEAKKVLAFAEGEALILARVVASELGMTAATAAGNTARLAAKTGADAAGKAEDVATGAAQIQSNAMRAASGAYAAVAGIPYVGPALAPVAAATAFAAVMAYDVISAEGGAVIGAGVNPLAQLHENEMVLPAYIAQPLTSMLAGDAMNDQSGGDTSISNTFHNTYHGAGNLDEDSYLAMLNSAVRSGRIQKYPAIARMMRR
jgi:hypothetical protein